jgi:ABC-type thiamine transport system ATPase subunit
MFESLSQRTVIIGNSGAGKSALAESLAAFRGAERSGELFLYVNESVVPLPWISDIFYWNNRGSAEVVIKRLN